MRNPLFNYFSRNRQTNERYLFSPHIGRIKQYPGTELVVLPDATSIEMDFSELIQARRSNREYAHATLSLETLSQLLYWSAAELGERCDGEGHVDKKMHRPHPSGGAKYPLELYIFADRIKGLERGAYHYRPDQHALEHITSLSAREMHTFKSGYQYEFVQNMSAIIVFSFILERGMPTYGALAYKLGLIEAGHIAQNMYLLAAACDAKCTALGGHNEEFTDDLLMLDGYNETTFYSVGLGQG